jgi:hypothetical protein
MRLTIVLPSLFACALLAGCDDAPQAPAPPPPQQACNCTPAAATPAVPAQEAQATRHRHRHAWHRHAETYSETGYSESETTEYGYASDSHIIAESGNERAVQAGGRLWIDGFGRAYHADHAARAAGTMTRARLKPWAHYDEDCDR